MLVNKNSKRNVGSSAVVKARELQELIDVLNNTTVGSLSERIDENQSGINTLSTSLQNILQSVSTNTSAIDTLATSLQAVSNKADENETSIDALSTSLQSLSQQVSENASAIALINSKIDAIASIFSVIFNTDGSLSSQGYTSHMHSYEDGTIADTVDGTGTQTDTTRTTQGVS